jgi:hypothetical protein
LARSKRATRSCTSSSGIVPRNAISFHDDLINRNLLVDGDRISAFLDWGSSMYGDFLYDIAQLIFYQPWFPAWRNIAFAAEARATTTASGSPCRTLPNGCRATAYGSAWPTWPTGGVESGTHAGAGARLAAG